METILDRHIVIDPNICHGKPYIEGHRIRVQDIAIWVLTRFNGFFMLAVEFIRWPIAETKIIASS